MIGESRLLCYHPSTLPHCHIITLSDCQIVTFATLPHCQILCCLLQRMCVCLNPCRLEVEFQTKTQPWVSSRRALDRDRRRRQPSDVSVESESPDSTWLTERCCLPQSQQSGRMMAAMRDSIAAITHRRRTGSCQHDGQQDVSTPRPTGQPGSVGKF